MSPEEAKALQDAVATLQQSVGELRRDLADKDDRISELETAVQAKQDSQLSLPLDPVSKNILRENLIVAAAPFVSGTPTINGHIPVVINNIPFKIPTVS